MDKQLALKENIIKTICCLEITFALFLQYFSACWALCWLVIVLIFIFFKYFSDAIHEENIQRARFVELHNGRVQNSQFGDVISIANGKLEIAPNEYLQLVEMTDNCIKYCLEETIDAHNVTAFWSVQKIRHRDEHRGYRFELKITIRKLKRNHFDSYGQSENQSNIRSFLLRDQDYPYYFDTSIRKKAKMEKRIFNTIYDNTEHPFHLDYRNHLQFDHGAEHLNIGEYYAKGSAPVIKYHVRTQDSPFQAENVNHLHHHYFLNKEEVPIFKTSHYEKSSHYPGPFNGFPNQQSQISIPKLQNHESFGGGTTPQTPFHFPDELKLHEPIQPTTYRGHYDDNRESILEGIHSNHLNGHTPPNQVAFPARHSNVIPIPSINTTPTYSVFEHQTSPTPSIQSLYTKQILNSNRLQLPIHQSPHNPLYWLNQEHPDIKFVPSNPYRENHYSELDPIFHGSTVLVTPPEPTSPSESDVNSEPIDTDVRFVSQLPLQDDSSNDQPYDIPTETHETTATNTDPSFTTPLNAVTTTKQVIPSKDNSYPDSINAQLPPPDSGADVRVPYVEAESSTPSSKKTKPKFVTTVKYDDSSAETTESSIEQTTKKPRHRKYKSRITPTTSTTEKPSWSPKRPRLRSSDKFKTNSEILKNFDKKSSYSNRRKLTLRRATTTIEPITVTQELTTENEPVSTTEAQIDELPRTSQSVRKSVSVHIAEKVTVVPKKSSRQFNGKNDRKKYAKIKKVEKNEENRNEDKLE